MQCHLQDFRGQCTVRSPESTYLSLTVALAGGVVLSSLPFFPDTQEGCALLRLCAPSDIIAQYSIC